MDILYKKVFNNVFLSNTIYSYVQKKKNSNYRVLEDWPLDIVLNDAKLFNLKFSSYQYYKYHVKDQVKSQLIFGNLQIREYSKEFFESRVIEFKIFVELYQDFKHLLFKNYSKRKVVKNVVSSLNKEKLYYLVHDQELRFNIDQFSKIVSIVCNIKDSKLDYLEYVIELFKYYNLDYKQLSNVKTINKKKGIFNSLENINNNMVPIFEEDLLSKLTVNIEVLGSLMRNKKCDFYRAVFPYCKSNIESNSLKNNILISDIIRQGSKEMARVYVEHYRNKRPVHEGCINIIITSSGVLSEFITNGIISVSHSQLKDFEFLIYNDENDIKSIIDYCVSNKIKFSMKDSLRISRVYNFQALKYLYAKRNLFTKELIFCGEHLLRHACLLQDLDMVKFCINTLDAQPKSSTDSFKNTSFEIFKYFYDNFQNFSFTDIQFSIAFNNQLEFAEFLVERFKKNDNRFQLSYRSLDIVSEKGYWKIAEYLLKEIGYLGVSSDFINNVIKSGNLDVINKFKNVSVTKPGENFSIDISTFVYIKSNNRNDILLSLNDSIFSKYFNKFNFRLKINK